jgi:hypothetical protein
MSSPSPNPSPNQTVEQPTASSKNTSAFVMFLILSVVIGLGGLYLNSKILGKRRVDDAKRNWVMVLYVVAALLLLLSVYIIMNNPPDAPTSVTAVNGISQAVVSFIGKGSSYTVTSSPSGITATGSSSPITITGLTNGTSYTFTVTASNMFGTSASSSPSNAVTPVPVPSPPTSLVATTGNSSASIAFALSTYAVSYTVTSSPGGITATGSASPIVVSGLTNGTSYTFTMTATNSSGTSSASAASNAVTPTFPLATPTNIVATAGNASASVSFTAVSGATSYTVTSTPGGLTGTGSASPITVNGLTNGTSYTFVVRASNSSGTSANSSSSNAVTPSVPNFITLSAGTSFYWPNCTIQLKNNTSNTITINFAQWANSYPNMPVPPGMTASGSQIYVLPITGPLAPGQTKSFKMPVQNPGVNIPGYGVVQYAFQYLNLGTSTGNTVMMTTGQFTANISFDSVPSNGILVQYAP